MSPQIKYHNNKIITSLKRLIIWQINSKNIYSHRTYIYKFVKLYFLYAAQNNFITELNLSKY